MFNNLFGIEVEFTGITRTQAAKVAAEFLGGTVSEGGDYYDTKKVTAPDGRVWKFMYDSSIRAQKKENGRITSATDLYKVELVSPVLSYREDIDTLQELIRRLRKAGGFANSSAGIHIHLDGSNHTPKSIRNFINIIASKNDLFYKVLQIEPDRMRFCKKMDSYLVDRMNQRKPKTMAQIENIWYEGYGENRGQHYHSSRYHFLNLHSFFSGNHTVELRGFNSDSGNGTLHAGVIRSYIILALAQQPSIDPAECQRKEKPDREREIRHEDIPQPHRVHWRRIQELPRTPLQAPFGFGGMAISDSRLKVRPANK